MKSIFTILSFAFLLISCGPSRYAIPVEMRHPSKSGLELAGKIVSVLYSVTGDTEKDLLNKSMADAFADALEKEYCTGEGSVGTYGVNDRNGAYASRDSLFKYLIATGADMVFLFAVPELEDRSSSAAAMKVNLYCFDGMDKDERVHSFSGSTIISSVDADALTVEATDAGKKIAEPFYPQWKQEQYSIAYFDSSRWYEALINAEQYDWKGAMDIWFTLLDSNDMMKRACAEYNIAVACYMLGDYDLAEEWLDRSDTENRMPTLSDALRKRIEARKR